MSKFIQTSVQLIDSVDRFMDSPEYWREAVGNHPKYFVHYQKGEKHFFGLSKFCAFDGIGGALECVPAISSWDVIVL